MSWSIRRKLGGTPVGATASAEGVDVFDRHTDFNPFALQRESA